MPYESQVNYAAMPDRSAVIYPQFRLSLTTRLRLYKQAKAPPCLPKQADPIKFNYQVF